MYVIHWNSIVIYSLYTNCWMDSYIAELPANLDNIFTGVANITSTPIGMVSEGGGKPWSGQERWYQHRKQPHSIHWCHFHLHISHKATNPWPHQPVNYDQLSVCPGEMKPYSDYPSTHGCLKSLRNKPQQK